MNDSFATFYANCRFSLQRKRKGEQLCCANLAIFLEMSKRETGAFIQYYSLYFYNLVLVVGVYCC